MLPTLGFRKKLFPIVTTPIITILLALACIICTSVHSAHHQHTSLSMHTCYYTSLQHTHKAPNFASICTRAISRHTQYKARPSHWHINCICSYAAPAGTVMHICTLTYTGDIAVYLLHDYRAVGSGPNL